MTGNVPELDFEKEIFGISNDFQPEIYAHRWLVALESAMNESLKETKLIDPCIKCLLLSVTNTIVSQYHTDAMECSHPNRFDDDLLYLKVETIQ